MVWRSFCVPALAVCLVFVSGATVLGQSDWPWGRVPKDKKGEPMGKAVALKEKNAFFVGLEQEKGKIEIVFANKKAASFGFPKDADVIKFDSEQGDWKISKPDFSETKGKTRIAHLTFQTKVGKFLVRKASVSDGKDKWHFFYVYNKKMVRD